MYMGSRVSGVFNQEKSLHECLASANHCHSLPHSLHLNTPPPSLPQPVPPFPLTLVHTPASVPSMSSTFSFHSDSSSDCCRLSRKEATAASSWRAAASSIWRFMSCCIWYSWTTPGPKGGKGRGGEGGWQAEEGRTKMNTAHGGAGDSLRGGRPVAAQARVQVGEDQLKFIP